MKALVVNCGSTSLKFRLFEMPDEAVLAEGKVERVGSVRSPTSFRLGSGPKRSDEIECPDQRVAIRYALGLVSGYDGAPLSTLDELTVIGFKPVHAKGIAAAVFIDDDVIKAMQEYAYLAPAHNPPYIEAFRIFRELVPAVPQVGVFEPAFHRTIPDHARTYAIPFEWTETHAIRRYGFHGASHSYVSARVPELLGRQSGELRIISCHLGGSSSVCAIKAGMSVDTSMGFSPQSGLPSATRSGDLDPFAVLYLIEQKGLTVSQVAEALATKSGLKGISGLSGDVRDLEAESAKGNRRAELALNVLVYETRKYIGAYAAVLEGLDVLAFTGGIGENAKGVREAICRGLGYLGVEFDTSRNDLLDGEGIISADTSPIVVVVISANEELTIARETVRLLTGGSEEVVDTKRGSEAVGLRGEFA